MRQHEREHPGIEIPPRVIACLDAAGFEDNSWHNDAVCFFHSETHRVLVSIAEEDEAERESLCKRFTAWRCPPGDIGEWYGTPEMTGEELFSGEDAGHFASWLGSLSPVGEVTRVALHPKELKALRQLLDHHLRLGGERPNADELRRLHTVRNKIQHL